MHRETVQTYDTEAKVFEAESEKFWLDERTREFFIFPFHAHIKAGQILNIGSGPGIDSEILRRWHIETICLDASEAMCEMAKQRGFPTVRADFSPDKHLPFPDGLFGGVWVHDSFCHLPKINLPKVLSEVGRVLRYEGTLGLTLIEGRSEGLVNTRGIYGRMYIAEYNTTEIHDALMTANFKRLGLVSDYRHQGVNYLSVVAQKDY